MDYQDGLPQRVKDAIFKHFGANPASWVVDLARECYGIQADRVAQLDAELSAGDSWLWIRAKFEKCGQHLSWYKPRTDSLIGTRYEVMGWLHCLFASASPKVYIDIALEQQKKADEALTEVESLKVDRHRLSIAAAHLLLHCDVKPVGETQFERDVIALRAALAAQAGVPSNG